VGETKPLADVGVACRLPGTDEYQLVEKEADAK